MTTVALDLKNEKLPWHAKHWEFFVKRFVNNKIPHGILIAGRSGLGKYTLARQMAALLLCDRPYNDAPCQQCAGCQLLAAGNHGDFYSVSPEEDSQVIKIDAIRTLTVQLAQTAQQAGYKVVIIHPAEAMNIAASNALLKTLEEPPSNTIVMLLSNEPKALLATLRSRCQVMVLAEPSTDVSEQWLQEQGISTAQSFLALSENTPLAAMAFAADEAQQAAYQRFMQALLDFHTQRNPLAFAAECAALTEAPLLTWLQQFYMDVIRLHTLRDHAQLAHQTLVAKIRAIMQSLPLAQCFAALAAIQDLEKLLRKQPNLNLPLQWEALLITLLRDCFDTQG